MNTCKTQLLAIVLLCFSSWLSAEEAATAQLVKQLQKMNSLSAHFEQTIRDKQGELLQQAEGLLKVKRPRRFYWKTEQPYEHLAVTDGTVLWLHDIDLEQISRQPFNADMDKAPALLLSGELEQISKQYTVTLLSAGQSNNVDNSIATGRQDFELLPLSVDSVFQRLVISFDQTGLVSMLLQDSFEQETQLDFSDVSLNSSIPDSIFQFNPPDDIDVVINEN